MGFLSKLLGGDKKAEKAAKDFLNSLLSNAANASSAGQNSSDASPKPENTTPYISTSSAGGPWGDSMPAEENQYNYNGTFTDYFEHIFREDFPAYRFEKSYEGNGRRIIYTFYSATGKALVVELMTEASSANKIRKDCKNAGVEYLRFYYDHSGWWNTRSYVTGRIGKILI